MNVIVSTCAYKYMYMYMARKVVAFYMISTCTSTCTCKLQVQMFRKKFELGRIPSNAYREPVRCLAFHGFAANSLLHVRTPYLVSILLCEGDGCQFVVLLHQILMSEKV